MPTPSGAGEMFTRCSMLALVATVTDDVAMAISANTGCIHPMMASGIIATLEKRDHKRFCLILRKVARLRLMASTTPVISPRA